MLFCQMMLFKDDLEEDDSPILQPGYILAIQVTAGITSILSTLGASLIIFTYIAFRNLRTTARQLLVSISIADIIVAISHFVGLFANFKRFIYQYNNETWNTSTTDPLCITQAAFSMFGTLASFLLSLAIGVYLVGILVWKKPRIWKRLVPIFYYICWGIPAIMVLPNVIGHYYGFADIGWCYIAKNSLPSSKYESYLLAEYLSYDIWVYLVFIALPVLYITAFVYIRCKKKKNSSYEPLSVLHTPQEVYSGYNENDPYTNLGNNGAPPLAILGGIGDNAQGLVNAILFCVFTKQARQQLFSRQSYLNMCKCRHNSREPEYQTPFDESNRESEYQTTPEESTELNIDRQFYDNAYGVIVNT
ncbi:cyclic AMP receptor-like protein A isoform X3 [Halichondria panicea]|uniref:cyclic AMP receptor-like protein A isoform X3 n=1 Tax=Halichondria panicea TaxID=6063 RepID=UPI00312B758C